MKGRVIIQAMTLSDLPFCNRMAAAAGWNQTEADWRRYLRFEPEGCFIAWLDGVPAGTATTLAYGKSFGWIGMIITAPEFRRRGVGSALLQRCITRLEGLGIASIKLDATPEGRRVYERIGFVDEYELRRMAGVSRSHAERDSHGLPPIDDNVLDEIIAWDAVRFGAERGAVLRQLICENSGHALAMLDAGSRGYIMTNQGRRAHHIGPWVSEDPATAERLLGAALSWHAGEPVFIDIPLPNPHALDMCRRAGLTVQRPFVRMYRGANDSPGLPAEIYGTGRPEKG